MTCTGFARLVSGLALFSRRRRTTFSTTMIASSTNAPRAIAMPPSVMVLIVAPSTFMARIAATSDNGRAINVIAVDRQESKKAKTIATTRIAPSRRDASRFSMDISMKSAWRKSRVSIFIPAGRPACTSASVASRRRVSSSVLAAGWRWMPSTTAGFPLAAPMPRFGALPRLTSATCRTRIG